MTKRNPISVPEGYFQSLEQRLLQIPAQQAAQQAATPSRVHRFVPYLAYAASLAVLAVLGNFILRKTAVQEDTGWDYVSYLAQSLDPDGLVELKETEELSEEDIRSYLLASYISVEQINMTLYEEDY